MKLFFFYLFYYVKSHFYTGYLKNIYISNNFKLCFHTVNNNDAILFANLHIL